MCLIVVRYFASGFGRRDSIPVNSPDAIGRRLHGQAVKTSPFHGGNGGSIPPGVIKEAFNLVD